MPGIVLKSGIKQYSRQSSSPQGAIILMQENKRIIVYQLVTSAMMKNKVWDGESSDREFLFYIEETEKTSVKR